MNEENHRKYAIDEEKEEDDDDDKVFNYKLEKKYLMFEKYFDTISNSIFINSFRFCINYINLNFKFKELNDLNDDLNKMFDESNPTYVLFNYFSIFNKII